MTRPVRALVQRRRSGQRRQCFAKLAVREAPMVTVCPAGQVTVPAAVSMSKSSRLNPPGTAERNTGGLMTVS